MQRNETDLGGHKRHKKTLNPPFLSSGLNFAEASWINDRLPEMLWAVLVIGNTKRSDALSFFRHVAKFVESNHDCWDITITGISKLKESKRSELMKHMLSYSEKITSILKALILFSGLPSLEDWRQHFKNTNPKQEWDYLFHGVGLTYWHQSQEATDCRWAKILCLIVGEKVKFASSIKNIDDVVRGILEYPNYGDLKRVRPFIRAMEITPDGEKKSKWSEIFWEESLNKTTCIPEDTVDKELSTNREELLKEATAQRHFYIEESKSVRYALVNHFFNTITTSGIDAHHETAFGITFYGLFLFTESVLHGSPNSIAARLLLRSIVEVYITFAFLNQEGASDPEVWYAYRKYGIGQMKLSYLKIKGGAKKPNSIDFNKIDSLANEDKWIEFVPIKLGHWEEKDLRKLSDKVGLKDVYDKFYDYTSGFVHGNWAAIRESSFQKCINPLHRYHRIPTFGFPIMNSTTLDFVEIFNCILVCLSKTYPEFKERINIFEKDAHLNDDKPKEK
ncbi:MAG: DUF5677 domain-containing protein [Candidatus Peribacteraceae bacterium]|nr:DUF5677 domain-containing protein [Candidatus Peribacteraceae bacterium]